MSSHSVLTYFLYLALAALPMSERLYLIDASVYIFRAYFSLPSSMCDAHGQQINAVYGFGKFLADILSKEQPSHVVAAFDGSLTTSFRNDIYPAYKANRELPPAELENQLAQCQAITDLFGVTRVISDTYEADDLIGSLAAQSDIPVSIVTTDKDLVQLVQKDRGDEWFNYAKQERFNYDELHTRYELKPEQFADYLALTGDAVDNIPGVKGLGPKAAVALLQAYESLAGIYQHLDEVPTLAVRGAKRLHSLLIEQQAQAELSLALATIALDVEVPTIADTQWAGFNEQALKTYVAEQGFGRQWLTALSS